MVTARGPVGWGIAGKRKRVCKGTEVWGGMVCRAGRQAGLAVYTQRRVAVAGHAPGEVSQDRGREWACTRREAERR